MEKIKQYKEIILITLIILGGLFYWLELRPVIVKSNCSWFKETIPADAGVTKEQAEANRKEFEQRVSGDYKGQVGSSSIHVDRITLLRNSTERPPQPEHEVTREATKNEYAKCLQHHGL
jgi:hypothetical protein